MILTEAERASLLLPTVLFLVFVFWDYLFHTQLEEELNSEFHLQGSARVDSLVTRHYLRAAFGSAIVLLIANGAGIAVYWDLTSGIVHIALGAFLAVTGLILSFMGDNRTDLATLFFILVNAFAGGQLAFLGVFGLPAASTMLYMLFPWILFGLVCFGVFVVLYLLIVTGT